MPTYEIVNPSDPYTIKGEPLVVCAMVLLIGQGRYGLDPADDETEDPGLPMFILGGDPEEWLKEKFGVESLAEWLGEDENLEAAADCLESVVIGRAGDRRMVESALAEMPDGESRKRFLAKYHDDKRSSLNDIGGLCQAQAAKFRECLAARAAEEGAGSMSDSTKICRDEFDEWCEGRWQQYASETIERGGLTGRLRFEVSLAGVFRVTLGSKTLYEGESFDEAKVEYEGA